MGAAERLVEKNETEQVEKFKTVVMRVEWSLCDMQGVGGYRGWSYGEDCTYYSFLGLLLERIEEV
jgi:hypothetical protein